MQYYRRFLSLSVVMRVLLILVCTLAGTRLTRDSSIVPGRAFGVHDVFYLAGVAATVVVVLGVVVRETRLRESAAALAELEISDSMLRLLTIVDTLQDGVYVCNQQGRLTLVNPAGWRLLGLPDDGTQLRPMSDLVPLVQMRTLDGDPVLSEETPLALARRGESVEGFTCLVYNATYQDDRCLRLSAAPLRNSERTVVGAVAVAVDITEQSETLLALQAQANTLRGLNSRLEQLASRDGLTGLFNHRRFVEELSAAAGRARRYNHCLALMLVDVDHFKQINDTHGHQAGDLVLLELAGRLQQGVRSTDAVGRLGGDEFAVLLPETDYAGALALAERLRASARLPVRLTSGETVPVTISVGFVCREGATVGAVEDLLKEADEALYAAKRAGRDGVVAAPVTAPPRAA